MNTIKKISEKQLDQVIGYALANHRNDIINALVQSGYANANALKDSDLGVAFLKAVKDSASFRGRISQILTEMVQKEKGQSKSFVNQPVADLDVTGGMFDNYFNVIDHISTEQINRNLETVTGSSDYNVPNTTSTTNTKTQTAFGSALSGLVTSDTLSKVFNVGLDALSTKLQTSANKGSEERALQLKAYELQIAALNAAGKTGNTSTSSFPTWAKVSLAVVGAAGIGLLVYKLATKKKKAA